MRVLLLAAGLAAACSLSLPAMAGERSLPRMALPACAPPAAADDDADEDEADDDDVGFFAVGPDLCLRLGGSVTAAMNGVHRGGPVFAKRLNRILDTVFYDLTANFSLETRQRLAAFDLVTYLEIQGNGQSTSLSQAYIQAGPVTMGLATSLFDYWNAENFLFRAITSSQYPWVLGADWAVADGLSLGLSLEDQTTRRVVPTGYAGARLPDVVGRLRIDQSWGTAQLTAALRQTRFASVTAPAQTGWAMQIGTTLPVPWTGEGDQLVLEAAYARHAPGYLGIYTVGDAAGFTLPISILAEAAERMTGWSGAISFEHNWSPTWRSNIFVTAVGLVPEKLPGYKKLHVLRSAANLIWAPVDGLEIGMELGYFRIMADQEGIVENDIFSRDQWALLASMSRSF